MLISLPFEKEKSKGMTGGLKRIKDVFLFNNVLMYFQSVDHIVVISADNRTEIMSNNPD